MADELTPADVLNHYRSHADPIMKRQAEEFRRLSPSDQRELLFWMNMHQVRTIQMLHGMLDAKAASATSFPIKRPEPANQDGPR